MEYSDKELVCSDCGNSFVFTTGEQEFYSSRGFTNEPRRCPTCREARKAQRGGGSEGSRELYDAVCAQCGKETQVPFKPRGIRPVYCSDCYSSVRS